MKLLLKQYGDLETFPRYPQSLTASSFSNLMMIAGIGAHDHCRGMTLTSSTYKIESDRPLAFDYYEVIS